MRKSYEFILIQCSSNVAVYVVQKYPPVRFWTLIGMEKRHICRNSNQFQNLTGGYFWARLKTEKLPKSNFFRNLEEDRIFPYWIKSKPSNFSEKAVRKTYLKLPSNQKLYFVTWASWRLAGLWKNIKLRHFLSCQEHT